MDCAALVAEHLRSRRSRNPRYSLRAFARDLGVSHSTLSGVMSGRRLVTERFVRRVAACLALDARSAEELVTREHARRLTTHASRADFTPDLRDLAVRSGLSIDVLCVALHRLLSEGRLAMTSSTTWTLRGADESRP